MRPHPPFRIAGPGRNANYASRGGVEMLADDIAAAWRACGHDIQPELVPPDAPGAGWAIRLPQLVNGLPAASASSPEG